MLETKNNKIMKGVKQVSMWVLWLAVIAVFPAISRMRGGHQMFGTSFGKIA